MAPAQANKADTASTVEEDKIWKQVEFHHVGLIVSAIFGSIAILVSWYLVWRHCTHYHKPWEQKQYVHRASCAEANPRHA